MKKKVISKVIISYLQLFVVWFAYTLYLLPILNQYFSPAIAEFLNGIIKCILWILPPLGWMISYNAILFVEKKDLFQKDKTYYGYYVCAMIIILTIMFMFFGKIKFQIHPWYEFIGLFLIVGITEEIMFRGWILNVLIKTFGENLSNIIQSVLFAFIHIPIWIYSNNMDNFFSSFITVCIIGLGLGKLFIETKSLKTVILVHMIYDGMFLFIL